MHIEVGFAATTSQFRPMINMMVSLFKHSESLWLFQITRGYSRVNQHWCGTSTIGRLFSRGKHGVFHRFSSSTGSAAGLGWPGCQGIPGGYPKLAGWFMPWKNPKKNGWFGGTPVLGKPHIGMLYITSTFLGFPNIYERILKVTLPCNQTWHWQIPSMI